MSEKFKSIVKPTNASTNMNTMNAKAVSYSLALVSGIVYLLCVFFFAIAPQTTLNLFKYMFHGIDITKIASGPASLGNVVIGFAEIIVFCHNRRGSLNRCIASAIRPSCLTQGEKE